MHKNIMNIRSLSFTFLLFSAVADAHHSQSYFSKEFSQVTGTILQLDWRNPHIRFNLESINSDGKQEVLRIETNSIYYLERAGITKDRINVGDKVTVGGYASIKAGGEFLGAELQLPDGENLLLIRDGVTTLFSDIVQNTLRENKGIFRVWSIPQNNNRELYTPLTAAAQAKMQEFDLLNNFTTRCEPGGMPRLMWYPHPYEFEDLGNQILLRTEMYDAVRTIHMDRSTPPDGEPHSRLGYSVGHWEGSELVVKTSLLNWEYYDTRGIPQSELAEVVERYTISNDQSRLDYFITTTDPETFTEPATIKGHWLALGETIKPYNCEVY